MNKKELYAYFEEQIKKTSLVKPIQRVSAYKAVLDLLDENNKLNQKLLSFQRLLIVCVERLDRSNINSVVSVDNKDLEQVKHKCLAIELSSTSGIKLVVLDENNYHQL